MFKPFEFLTISGYRCQLLHEGHKLFKWAVVLRQVITRQEDESTDSTECYHLLKEYIATLPEIPKVVSVVNHDPFILKHTDNENTQIITDSMPCKPFADTGLHAKVQPNGLPRTHQAGVPPNDGPAETLVQGTLF